MSIKSLKQPGLPAAAAVSFLCLGLLAGCNSSGKSGSANGAANPPAGGSTGSAAAGGSTGAAGGSFNAACPSTATVSAALGQSFPAPTQNGGGGSLVCNYTNSSGGNLVIVFAPLPGGSAAALKGAMDSQAQAQKVTASQVPGLGDAAYMFTQDDAATNASGIATTSLAILDGSEDIDLTAEAPAAGVEALGRAIVSG